MLPEFPHIANPPNVIADPVVLHVFPRKFATAYFLAEPNPLEHRAIGMATAPDVVNFRDARSPNELHERLHQIEAVNVVPHLLPLITEDAVRPPTRRAFHEIGKKTVQLRSRMRRSGQTTAAKTRRWHAEVATVFLDEHVGRAF